MTTRRFVRPTVTEVRNTRGVPQGQPVTAPSQRDLVTASLIARPDRRESGPRGGGRPPR